jgi:hypothetical protein
MLEAYPEDGWNVFPRKEVYIYIAYKTKPELHNL